MERDQEMREEEGGGGGHQSNRRRGLDNGAACHINLVTRMILRLTCLHTIFRGRIVFVRESAGLLAQQ